MGINREGSILIWSIFLVIFVTFSFLYISTGISKQIDKNKIKIQQANNAIAFENFSDVSGKVVNGANQEDYSIEFYNSFATLLKQDEKMYFSFAHNNTGSIEMKNGGPIYYTVFDSGSVYTGGVLENNENVEVSLSGNLMLQNLGGGAELNIDFETASGISFPYNYYKKGKTIGGIDIVKEMGIVK